MRGAPATPAPEQWVTVYQAQAIVGVSRKTIWNWIKAHKVTFRRTAGNRVRILASSLWLDDSKELAAAE